MLERGAPLPQWLDDEPEGMPADSYYMQAFWDLSTERQLGFTVGPIPRSAIHRYPGVDQLSPAMMALFKAVISSMDNTYREWGETERKKAQKHSNSRGATQSHIGETSSKS